VIDERDEHVLGRTVDPIDALIPPPRPWWYRLIGGAVAVAAVATIAFLWSFGYITPQPDCCGSGSGSAYLSLTPDGSAVAVSAYFYNSSGRELTIESARADLPGAEVLAVEVLDPDNDEYPTDNVSPLPAVAPPNSGTRLWITFLPETCVDSAESAWGRVTLDLDVAGWWSIGRRHEIPVIEQRGELAVFAPAWVTQVMQSPLADACAMLRR
jgi:hypothetical protein